jgi:hypothetical protein
MYGTYEDPRRESATLDQQLIWWAQFARKLLRERGWTEAEIDAEFCKPPELAA